MSILHNNTWTFLVSSSFPLLISIIRSTAKIETQLCAARGRRSEQRLRVAKLNAAEWEWESRGVSTWQLDPLGCSLRIRAVWKSGVCISKSKRSIVPTNVLGKGHPSSPVQNCMISLENKSHERRLEPISSRFWRVFQLKKNSRLSTVQLVRATEAGTFECRKKPRWTAPAEARRPRIQRKFGEYLISPPPKNVY